MPLRIKTISQLHELRRLPKPQHPLISVIDLKDIEFAPGAVKETVILEFYGLSLKQGTKLKYKYGQQDYDFDEGVMFFTAPGQIIGIDHEKDARHSGWVLFIHPEFIWNTSLAKTIKKYEFFDYSVNEALFVSDKEKHILNEILNFIKQEYTANIDKFSQDIITTQIELLLNYAERFYHRQFLTRRTENHEVLTKLEEYLNIYFDQNQQFTKGLPAVKEVASSLNISVTYLGSLLKTLTGLSTQQHIHEKVISLAKDKLSTTTLSVNEVAYQLGFEHSQSFSKLFKSKTQQSPLGFRQSFNLVHQNLQLKRF